MTSIPHHADKSFWLAHSGDYEPSPPLRGSAEVDIAVIGAGFTGLSTAYHARQADASASVAVVDAECVAFGASGRTSGWLVPIPVLDPDMARLLYGQHKLGQLQDFAWNGMDYVRDLIAREDMDSDLEMPGATFTMLRGHEKHMEKFARYWTDQSRASDSEVMDRATVNDALNSDAFCGGVRMPHSGQVNPVKHARELKRIAVESGAQIYEQTPVLDVEDDGTRFTLRTPEGELRARHLVLATNGFTHLLPPALGLRRAQVPMHVYQLMTEPLTEADWAALGWKHRGQFYDKTSYCPATCRPAVDGRLQFNLCDIYLGRGRAMEEAQRMKFYTTAERMFEEVFPAFRNLRIAQRWSGACSIPFDVRPQVGALRGGRLSYAFGYSGAGVMMSQNFGRILADLALQRSTDLTEQWFVAIEGKDGHAGQRRFPPLPGLIAGLRFFFQIQRTAAIARRRRLGLA